MVSTHANAVFKFDALVELLRTAETLWNASRIFFAHWELSPSQFNILNLLHLQPEGCTQVELSRELIMHRSNVTGLIDRLEARGLVKRTVLPNDRRSITVSLTAIGKKLVREIEPHYQTAAEKVWSGVSDSQISGWMHQLKSIAANAEQTAMIQSEPLAKGNSSRRNKPGRNQ